MDYPIDHQFARDERDAYLAQMGADAPITLSAFILCRVNNWHAFRVTHIRNRRQRTTRHAFKVSAYWCHSANEMRYTDPISPVGYRVFWHGKYMVCPQQPKPSVRYRVIITPRPSYDLNGETT